MKIDLDELEHNARDALSVKSETTVIYSQVLIALIARIRELESGLQRLAVRGIPQATWINALLKKGAVLP